jgi:ferredoxin
MGGKIPRLDAVRLILHYLRRVTRMKVTITKNCMGDRNCNDLCPEVFEYDEDALLSKIKLDAIPDHLKDVVRQAAAECGADAIEIEE